MRNREELLREARKDIDSCLKIWSEILEEILGDSLIYAYAKGSCVKAWTSDIDYVPILSDVDLHVSTTYGEEFSTSLPFDEAMEMSKCYEETFNSERPDHLHIPRMQIISVDQLVSSTNVEYVPPSLKEVKVLYGKPVQAPIPDAETIRQIDRRSTVRQEEFIESLPYRIMDSTGLGFWGIIRCGGLGWRVAPSPYRILSQKYPEPIEVWSWNRSRVCDELEKMAYDKISRLYRSFYDNCWKIYLSDFKSSEAFRMLVSDGYLILKECLKEIKQLVD